MGRLQQVSKTTLFAVGVALIVAGAKFLDSQATVVTAIILIILGIALIVLYAILLEKQVTEKAEKRVMERLKLERKRNS